MEISVSVTYDVKGRLEGRKKSSHYGFTEQVSVELREVDPAEAPVSCIWSPGDNAGLETELWHHQADDHWCDTDGNHMTRWYDGRHWKRLLLSDCSVDDWDNIRQPPLTAPMLVDELASGRGQRALGVAPARVRYSDARPIYRSPMEHFAVVTDENRSLAMFNLDRFSTNSIIVDGHIYRSCMEPYFVVSKSYLGESQCRDIKVWTTAKPFNNEALLYVEHVLPITQFDKAFAVATAGLNGKRRSKADLQAMKTLATKKPSFVFDGAMGVDYISKWEASKLIDEVKLHGTRVPGPWTHELAEALRSMDDDIRIARLLTVIEEYGSYLAGRGVPVHLLEHAISVLTDRPISVLSDQQSVTLKSF